MWILIAALILTPRTDAADVTAKKLDGTAVKGQLTQSWQDGQLDVGHRDGSRQICRIASCFRSSVRLRTAPPAAIANAQADRRAGRRHDASDGRVYGCPSNQWQSVCNSWPAQMDAASQSPSRLANREVGSPAADAETTLSKQWDEVA